MAISKYVILKKLLFYRAENDNARFKTSKLYRSLNNDFVKDIIPSKITTEKQETYRPNTILPGETFMEMLNRETSRNKKITHDFAEALKKADEKIDGNEINVKKKIKRNSGKRKK